MAVITDRQPAYGPTKKKGGTRESAALLRFRIGAGYLAAPAGAGMPAAAPGFLASAGGAKPL